MSDPQQHPAPVHVISSDGVSEKDIQMIGTVISSFAQPLAQAQQTAAIEATKQTQIIADATQQSHRWMFFIGFGVLALAGMALFKDKDQITEKLIIAMFSFLGGMGVGRTLQRR